MKTLIKLFVIVVVAIQLGGLAVDQMLAASDAVGVDTGAVVVGLAKKLWWLAAAAAASVVVSLFFTKEA